MLVNPVDENELCLFNDCFIRSAMETSKKNVSKTVAALNRFVTQKAPLTDDSIESDSAITLACVKFIEQVMTNIVVILCARDRVRYVSANCEDIIGYDCRYFQSLTLDETTNLLHDDDVNGFKNCVEKMQELTSLKYDAYKFLFFYRLRNPSGGYTYLQDEKIAIETRPGKFAFITLLKNITAEFHQHRVKLIIQKKIRNKYVTIHEFVPQSEKQNGFSIRQMEIVDLIARGFSNKSIADKLHLSISTVKNHKQLLFKKMNVKNSIEMLNSIPGTWPKVEG